MEKYYDKDTFYVSGFGTYKLENDNGIVKLTNDGELVMQGKLEDLLNFANRLDTALLQLDDQEAA